MPAAVERVAGLQAQYSPSPYIGLWSRLDRFLRDELTEALEARTVVKATLMRGTLHLVSAEDYLGLAAAWHAMRWAEVRTRLRTVALDLDALAQRMVDLAAEHPRTRTELRKLLAPELAGSVPETHHDWVLRAIAPLVHVPPSGTWRFHGVAKLVPAEQWLGSPLGAEAEGTTLLVRRYLEAFGPATRADIERWSYLPMRRIASGLAALEPLDRFRDEQGRELLDLPDAPRPDPETPVPVRFLPKWDNALIGYRDRTRIVSDAYYDIVIKSRNADVLATFLIDGSVAGAWRTERSADGAELILEPFGSLADDARAELVTEGERLLEFVEPDATERIISFAA